MKSKLKELLFLMFMTLGIIALLVLLSGCASTPLSGALNRPIMDDLPLGDTQTLVRTIASTDWLFGLLLVGFTASVFAALSGLKSGIAGCGACLAGMALKAAFSNVWVFWGCGLIVLGCIGLACVGLWVKSKAIRELIIGIQSVKNNYTNPEDAKTFINKTIQKKQSKETEKIVQYTKADLKLKGKI